MAEAAGVLFSHTLHKVSNAPGGIFPDPRTVQQIGGVMLNLLLALKLLLI